ncbi:hypothetical protein FACS1894188_09740 [Clostridia bacterium]|nr:hypothetical protein FACS1894188_09740 [Clostridia bacterium]
MADTSVWGDYVADQAAAAKAAGEPTYATQKNDTLDKNAFLKLLVTQMQYQDPLNPVDDKAFLAQMAQFTSLEQMQNLNAGSNKQQAFSMIGKDIFAEVYNQQTAQTDTVQGKVNAVSMKNGQPYLIVGDNGTEVALDTVKGVYDTASVNDQMKSIYTSLATSQNMALVGKYVQAITVDANMNPTGFVEGRVDYVKFANNQTILVVGNKEIFGQEVTSIGEDKMLLGKEVTYAVKGADGEYTNTTGTISDVKIEGSNSYLIVDGSKVRIDTITYVTEGLRYVGQNITSGSVSGTVDGVVIKDNTTYLSVGAELVPFTSVRGK